MWFSWGCFIADGYSLAFACRPRPWSDHTANYQFMILVKKPLEIIDVIRPGINRRQFPPKACVWRNAQNIWVQIIIADARWALHSIWDTCGNRRGRKETTALAAVWAESTSGGRKGCSSCSGGGWVERLLLNLARQVEKALTRGRRPGV